MDTKIFLDEVKKAKATLILFSALILSYLFLSNMGFFIPLEKIEALEFYLRQPSGLFTFMFVHIGASHLLLNSVSFLVFGLVLERALKGKHVVGIFFLSGFISAAAFLLVFPQYALVGASGGTAGMIAAAFMVKPKNTVLAFIAMLLLFGLGTVAYGKIFEESRKAMEKEVKEIRENQNKAILEGDLNRAQDLNRQIGVVKEKIAETEEGRQREEKTPSDALIHVFGAFVGLGYVLAFRREDYKKTVGAFDGFVRGK